MNLLIVLAYWIGACSVAALASLGLLWLGYRLFGQGDEISATSGYYDAKIAAIQKEIARLDAELEKNGHSAESEESLGDPDFGIEQDSRSAWLKWSNLKNRLKAIEDRLETIENGRNVNGE